MGFLLSSSKEIIRLAINYELITFFIWSKKYYDFVGTLIVAMKKEKRRKNEKIVLINNQ